MGETKSTFKKGRFDYLSWAYAWAMIKDQYPDANRKVYESESNELNYFSDGRTGYVKVGVTINDVEHIDYLPIMGHNNQSLTLDKITSFAVNKTIQRSTVKAIAMHGLGLSLWAGEDLVDISEAAPAVKQEAKPFSSTIKTLETKYIISSAIKKELGVYVK
mgnify:CR=1 FL=1